MIVLVSMIPPAWNVERDPMENQDEFDWIDFWLVVDLTEVVDRTERLDSKLDELIEDKAARKEHKFSLNHEKQCNKYIFELIFKQLIPLRVKGVG